MLEWGQEQDVTLDTKLAELGASNEVPCAIIKEYTLNQFLKEYILA